MQQKTIKICYVASVDITVRFIFLPQMRFFKQLGYHVHVACAPGKWVKELEAEGFIVKPIGFKRKVSPVSDLISFFRLYRYFKQEKFQIVQVTTLKAEVFGQLAARLADVPVIANMLNGLDFTADTLAVKKKVIIWLQRFASKCSDVVFSIAKKISDEARNEGLCNPDLIKYIGWGINSNIFDPTRFDDQFRESKKKQLGIPLDSKVAGIVARLVAEKGYLELFEAFKKVLVFYPNAVILAIGPRETQKRDALSPAIAKRYGLEGKVIFLEERTDLDELLAVMDVFVLPTHREGLGVSILEASAMQLPVIATPIVAHPEVVEPGKTGLLVPAKDTEALAASMLELFASPEKSKALGKAGREKVMKEFKEPAMFSRIQKEYERLMDIRIKSHTQRVKVCVVSSVDMTLKFMLFNQLKFLQGQGYEVHAVSAPGRWVKDLEAEGIIFKPIGFKRQIAPLADLISFIRLYLYFRKEKFQIVHTHTLKPELYGQLAAKLADVPVIINTIHGFFYGPESSWLKKEFFTVWDRTAAIFSDLVLSISQEIIQFCVAKKICAKEKMAYLGRDLDVKRFDRTRFSEDFIRNKKAGLGILPNQKVVGVVARLVAEKGYLELFEAFKRVQAAFPEAVLLVVGGEEPVKRDGITRHSVKKYGIEKQVMFLGERADTEELYACMDIFVLPTHREGLGAVLLEASAMELPVVSCRVGGVPEAVEDGATGILVPVGDVNRISESIINLLSNSQKAKAMGKAGREKIIREFSRDIVLKRLGDYYEQLLAKKSLS